MARIYSTNYLCLDGWQDVSQREGFPTGHVVSILGPAEDLGTCEMAVLAQFGLYPNQFLEKTLRSLPLHDWEIPSEVCVHYLKETRFFLLS